jgi:hypothetical protein
MAWIFAPYVGISEVHFSLVQDEVEALLGTPRSTKQTYTGKTRIEYGPLIPALVFAGGTLIEMNMLPELSGGLFFEELDLFKAKEDKVVRLLNEQDGAALDRNGFLIFAKLGIALSGYGPPTADQKAITIFSPRHDWNTNGTTATAG